MVIEALILVHYKQGFKIVIKTNLSNYISNAIFWLTR